MELAHEIAELEDQVLALQAGSMPSKEAIRTIIHTAQSRMEDMPGALTITDVPVKHHFSDGVYMRQVFLPAGMLVVGRTHTQNHIAMVTIGEISIFSEHEIIRFSGPRVWNSPAGTKRVVYAHTDTLFFTIHGTHERDPEKLLKELTE